MNHTSSSRSSGLSRFAWLLFALLCLLIGLYPLLYLTAGEKIGILTAKSDAVFESRLFQTGFYTHIIFGGIALLTGWAQFSRKWRLRYPQVHRNLGKAYVFSVFAGGTAGFGIAFTANGGPIAQTGFGLLALIWLYTTLQAYLSIRKGDVANHERMMIYSYAACFGAVTLRLWMPLLIPAFGAFEPAYRVVAWLAWAPNLAVAWWLVSRRGKEGVGENKMF